MKVKFTVYGEPQGKGRHRTAGRHEYTPQNTVLYENLIQTEFRRQCGGVRFPDSAQLDMRILAFYQMPTSASKKKIRQMLNREIRPTKKPDWDNIGKVVADSLNKIAYRDDSQVVDSQVRKFYSNQPRIEVTIQIAAS